MRRRNVWDDIGPLPLDSSAPPPPTFEASPLSRQVIPESQSTDATGPVDPDDPPPPFPPDADRPRSPPPSFEVAVAQLRINAQIRRRTGSISSASSRESERGPETEEEEKRREEREAWERDAAEGLGLEERLRRAFERMKRDEVGLGGEQMGEEAHVEHEEEPTERHEQNTAGQADEQMEEHAIAEASGTRLQDPEQQTEEQGFEAQESGHQMEQQNATLPLETEADTYVEPEPVSRFSREEKGKGRATDDRRDSSVVALPAENLSLAPVVTPGQDVPVLDTIAPDVAKENGERPSRSYLSSPRIRSGGVDKEEVSNKRDSCRRLLILG